MSHPMNMNGPTIVALLSLTIPSAWLFFRHVRSNGWVFGRDVGLAYLSLLAAFILVWNAFVVLRPPVETILHADFFHTRGLLFFAVSGLAYGAAIFPRVVAESMGLPEKISESRTDWLVAVPAWIWLVVLIVLGVVGFDT